MQCLVSVRRSTCPDRLGRDPAAAAHRSKSTGAVSHVGEANHELTAISEVRASERRHSRRYGQKGLVEVASLPGGFLMHTVDDRFNLDRGPFTARSEEAGRERERERARAPTLSSSRARVYARTTCMFMVISPGAVIVKGSSFPPVGTVPRRLRLCQARAFRTKLDVR